MRVACTLGWQALFGDLSIIIVGRERQNRKKTRPVYVRDPKRTRARTQMRTSGLTPNN